MRTLLLVVFTIGFPSSPSVAAEAEPQPMDVLHLDSFLQQVLAKNPGVQRILAQEDIAEGLLTSSLGIGDPVVGATGLYSRVEPNGISPFEPDYSNDAALSLSADYLHGPTGTRASVTYGSLFTDRSPGHPTLSTNYFQPSFTLRVTQPLLKNRWGVQDMLDIRLNEHGRRLASLRVQEQLESFVTSLAALYLDWYQAHREVLISKEVHQQAIEQEKLVRLKVYRQVAEAHELLRSQETREDYYARWRQALGRFEGLTRRIEIQMFSQNALSVIPTDQSLACRFSIRATASTPTLVAHTRAPLTAMMSWFFSTIGSP